MGEAGNGGNGDLFAEAKPPSTDLRHLYRGSGRPTPPSASELGVRLRALREAQDMSVREAARRARVNEGAIVSFETSGTVTGQVLLDLIYALSHSTSFDDAFALPRFTDIAQVVEHARKTGA